MKIVIQLYIIFSTLGLFRILYEIIDCLVSYKYETVDTFGHLNSKFLWLFIFALYVLISIVIAAVVLFKSRKLK